MTQDSLINRREFMQLLAAVSSGLAIHSPAQAFSSAPDQARNPPTTTTILGQGQNAYENLEDPWLTLANVQEHLFPGATNTDTLSVAVEGPAIEGPGAKDIAALVFLKNMLDAPDTNAEHRDFILKGTGWLNDLSSKQYQQAFIHLNPIQKEQILRKVEGSDAGGRWLSQMMTYLIEALLSDPVYGGNKNQLGWQWLEHIPGFPRPGVDKVYFKLGQNASSKRYTKA